MAEEIGRDIENKGLALMGGKKPVQTNYDEPQIRPLISIIVATRNVGPTIGQLLESLASQHQRNFEVIIIDALSDDSTPEIIRSYGTLVDHYVYERDDGIYDAWNKGLKLVSGEWVLFLGGDDRLKSSESSAEFAAVLSQKSPEFAFVSTPVIQEFPGRRKSVVRGIKNSSQIKRIYDGMVVPHTGLFHHRSLFEQFGQFDKSFSIAGDYEFFLRTIGKVKIDISTSCIEVVQAMDGISSRPRNRLVTMNEFAAARTMRGFPRHSWYSRYLLMRAWVRFIVDRTSRFFVRP